jgi:hypothetical protein
VDFLFLVSDTMLARDVVNQPAYQYCMPDIQVGRGVVLDAVGDIVNVFGVVPSFGTASDAFAATVSWT